MGMLVRKDENPQSVFEVCTRNPYVFLSELVPKLITFFTFGGLTGNNPLYLFTW